MARRRVYSVDNLHECMKYLEDSDDSAEDVTWEPSPKKTKKRGRKFNSVENMRHHQSKQSQEVRNVLPVSIKPSPGHAKQSYNAKKNLPSHSRSAANSLPKPRASTLAQPAPVLLSSMPASPDTPEPAPAAATPTKALPILLTNPSPAKNLPDTPEPVPAAATPTKTLRILLTNPSLAKNLPDTPEPLPAAATPTKTLRILLTNPPPTKNLPDTLKLALAAATPIKALPILLPNPAPAKNLSDTPEPVPAAATPTKTLRILLTNPSPAKNLPDTPKPVPAAATPTKTLPILLTNPEPTKNLPDTPKPAPAAGMPTKALPILLTYPSPAKNLSDTPEPALVATTSTEPAPMLLSVPPPVAIEIECETTPPVLPPNSPRVAYSPPDSPSIIQAQTDETAPPVLPPNSPRVAYSPPDSPSIIQAQTNETTPPVLPPNSPRLAYSPPDSPSIIQAQTDETTPPVLPPNSPRVAYSPPDSPSIIQAQTDKEIEPETSKSSRKKKKNISNWKKNIRKLRRNEGKEYVSAKGKTVPAKVLETYDHVCRYHCKTFTEDERKKIHSEYWKLGNWAAQTNFIRYCVRIEKPKRSKNKKKRSSVIIINNKRVCKDFFLKTLTISNRRFTNAAFAKTSVEGLPVFDRRGKHEPGNKTKEDKLKEVREHINSFPKFKSHYSREEAPLKKYLSPELSVSKMYSLYKEKLIEEGKQPVTEQIYRKVFNTEFNLGFYKLRSDTCNTCDKLENMYRCEENAEKKQSIKQEKEDHLMEVERTRQAKQRDKNDDNNMVHMITFDLEKTLPTPYLQTNLVYYKRQFWTYNLGIHDCKTGEAHMYMWGEDIASRGASEVASCLLKYVTSFVSQDCQHLIAYSDSCGGQNRNQIICKLWMYVVTHTSIATVDHKFMVSGHSYLKNDADFSHIEKRKKKAQNIYVPDDWMNLVENTRKKFKVHRIKQNDFISTDPVSKVIVNRKIDTTKNKVNWLKIRWMRFLKEQPKSMFFKETLDEETQFRHINMDAKKGNIPKVLPQLRDEAIKIKPAKIKDLMELLKFIPPIHHQFYNSLTCDENQPSTSANRSRGRPRTLSVQETDEESILDYPLE